MTEIGNPRSLGPERWRSALFVPGDDLRKLEKAAGSDADAIVIDLEDGVAAAAKPAARRNIAVWAHRIKDGGHAVVVRINAGWRDVLTDIDALRGAPIDAVMVPKVENSGRLDVVADIIEDLGAHATPVGLCALIETPAAFAGLAAIAGHPRVMGLALGSEDYALHLGVEPTPDCLDLPCQLLALAGAGKTVLAAPLSIAQFSDPEALRSAYARARRLGVSGALCIHPKQVAIANRTFAPSAEEVADAQRALEIWRQCEARGEAVASIGGQMIDKPVAARLQRLVDTL